MKKPSKAFLVIVAAIMTPAMLLFAWSFCHSEVECFWNPWIDTLDDGYSETAFDRLEIGMTVHQVQHTLGNAHGIAANASEQIWLTGDGKCKWGDFAWMGRALSFSNGVLVAKLKQTMYD